MRRRQKHSRKATRLLVPAIISAGVLLLAAGLFFAVRDAGVTAGTAVLTVQPAAIDYGEVRLDTPLTFSITVTNTGDGVLRFEEKPYVEVVEGC
jgi:hypothetical protein